MTHGKANIFVSLDSSAKGIHMSRLYLNLNKYLAGQALSLEQMNLLLDAVLQSHNDLSKSAMLKLSFDLPLHKKALLSDNYGYQSYSVVVNHKIVEGIPKTEIELTIPYSSTCPCSASLARQLNGEKINEKFSDESITKSQLLEWLLSGEANLATPHNQRSYAYIKLTLGRNQWVTFNDLIFELEGVKGTPVQTAVKREDEQEFARINGANLMFCEDAARKLKRHLETLDYVDDYWFKIEHQESLHAHNAVVIDHK